MGRWSAELPLKLPTVAARTNRLFVRPHQKFKLVAASAANVFVDRHNDDPPSH